MTHRKPLPQEGRDRKSTGVHQNGHKRQDGDGEYVSYGDPDNISSPPRSRAVTSPTNELIFLGRRISPTNERGEDVESALYVTPADTLNRSASHSGSCSNIQTSSASGSGGITDSSYSGSRSERKNMQLHQLTMSQLNKRYQSGGGTGGGEMIGPGIVAHGSKILGVGQIQPRPQSGETSDYSIPFNLLQGNMPRPHHHHRRAIPQTNLDNSSDFIIPINPPSTSPQSPSDRSDTTSPNSPRSNQSSEHEQQQHPQPASLRPPDNGDYAIPWDRSRIFQNIPRVPMSNKRHPARGRNEMPDELGVGVSSSRGGSLRGPSSPPLPLATSGYRYQSSGGGGGADMGQVPPPPPPDDFPPPPELPYDHNRLWKDRTVSDRTYNNTSPVNASGWGHGRANVSVTEDFVSRSQSLSSNIRPGRRLPTPSSGGEDWTREQTRPVPYSPSVWRQSNHLAVDPGIPLEDQPWYHGNLTRAEAEDVLRDQSDFSFLVRKSESCQTDFSLSIRDFATDCIHLRLVCEKEPNPGYVLGQFSRHFDKVADCIAFYMKQRLNIRGAEHKKLGYPVPRSHAVDKYHNSIATIGV